MIFLEALKKVNHDLGKEFYLAHGFVTIDAMGNPANDWQIGFYNKKTMVVFTVGEKITREEFSEMFKHPDKEIDPLEFEKIKITFKEAFEKVQKMMETEYSRVRVAKGFVLIQMIEGNPIWNVTLLTNSLSAINIKINAITGEIFKHSLVNIMQDEKSS